MPRPPNRLAKQSPNQARFSRTTGAVPPSPSETFNVLLNFPQIEAKGITSAQTPGVAGLGVSGVASQPVTVNPMPPGGSTGTLSGDVTGDPQSNLVQFIQQQQVNGPLTTGQTYICDSTGTLQPVVPVQPYVIGGEAVGNAPVWNGTAYAPGTPTGTNTAAFNDPPYTTGQTLDGTVPYAAFDATGGNLAGTLVQASGYTGPPLTIAKTDNSGHSVTFTAHAGDSVVGGIGPISSQYGTWTIVKLNSTTWITVERQGT